MNIPRRTVLAGGGAALAIATISPTIAADIENPLASFIAADGNSFRAIRVTAADRTQSQLRAEDIPADHSPYPLFKQFLTHKANRVAVYSAPPGHKTTAAPDENQLIYLVAGTMRLKVKGDRRDCVAGQVILMDASSHHRQQAGPAGYTAIKIARAD